MSLDSYLQTMPKVELHVHLEGTVRPTTLLELACRNGIDLPVSSAEAVHDWYVFRDFDHFIEIFIAICACLQTPEDFTRVTYEYGQEMARQNIRYAEVTWTPHTHISERLTWDDLLAAVNAGRALAREHFGVEMRWIPDIVRCNVDTGPTVVEWVTSPGAQAGGVVALGLGGPEVGWPPEPFEQVFRVALGRGLHSNPHAGETVGPESVWGAIHALHAERIGHGVRAIEDDALVAYLIEHQIPLEVNPTSNLCLGVYPTYAAHPLRALLEAGVCVTINSDDPALFNTTLNAEYLHAVHDCGLSLDQVEQAALNAVRASYLPADRKALLHDTFRAEYARLRAAHGVDEEQSR
ncbi:MAG: adenosine deaminase [Chloroflexi bacterium]|nr:adenosine deaminase [Chloroflexota bacterium]